MSTSSSPSSSVRVAPATNVRDSFSTTRRGKNHVLKSPSMIRVSNLGKPAKKKSSLRQKNSVMNDLLHMEDHSHHEAAKFVLDPYSVTRRYWDVVTTAAVLYLCWKIPFDVGFDWWSPPMGLKAFETFLDIWFGCDIVLNFNTGFVHDGHLVMNRRAIAKHYLEFWFWIDIIATIPFEVFGTLFESKSGRKAIKLVKWFKIPRLLRLGRILKYLRQYAKYYAIILVTGIGIVSVHMAGCIHVALMEPCANYAYDYYSKTDSSPEGPCSQANIFNSWITALHFGITMLTGNSIRALHSEIEEGSEESLATLYVHSTATDMMSVVAMCYGLIWAAYLFGFIGVITHHGDKRTWDFRVRLNQLKGEMATAGLPPDLQHRIIRYYDYLWINQLFGKQALLEDEDMSEPLKREICLYMFRDILLNVDFLKTASADVVANVCYRLRLEIFMPNEFVFRQNEFGHHIYIIKRGVVHVVADVIVADERSQDGDAENNDEHTIVCELGKNQFFGEGAILRSTGARRSCGVKCATVCECLSLNRQDFMDIMKKFPTFAEEMKALAAKREKESGTPYGSEELLDFGSGENNTASGNGKANFSFDAVDTKKIAISRLLESKFMTEVQGIVELSHDRLYSRLNQRLSDLSHEIQEVRARLDERDAMLSMPL